MRQAFECFHRIFLPQNRHSVTDNMALINSAQKSHQPRHLVNLTLNGAIAYRLRGVCNFTAVLSDDLCRYPPHCRHISLQLERGGLHSGGESICFYIKHMFRHNPTLSRDANPPLPRSLPCQPTMVRHILNDSLSLLQRKHIWRAESNSATT